ncbi:UbiX family flavin prenyltransferase [Magnetofaba australis]|nr:flavin prenyltransferase UbiX [Magnetofaba australis]
MLSRRAERNLPPITVAMTGASGSVYGLRLVECLLEAGRRVDLTFTLAAESVLEQECGLEWREEDPELRRTIEEYFSDDDNLRHYSRMDWMAPMASGSSVKRPMVVCPCSMGTLAAIAHGLADNLIERAADVAIKEQRPLIVVPRETPLSQIHLENMLKLAQMGVTILPAMPGFYNKPAQVEEMVDFVVARILDRLGVEHQLVDRWGE